MGAFIIRGIALACMIPGLIACDDHSHPSGIGAKPLALTIDSETIRAVMGQRSAITPLTPEPGDIWADFAFLKQLPSPPGQAPRQVAATTAPQAAATLQPERPTAHLKSFSVQLLAASSEAAARSTWQRLQRQMPDVIGGRAPSVIQAEVDGHAYWRLRTGGFATMADAAAFCSQLQSKHAPCWVVATVS